MTGAATACVPWQGETRNGYGLIYLGKERGRRIRIYAHRAMSTAYRGAVPRGRHLHHECGNRLCVNPWHLRIVTPAEHQAEHGSVRGAIAASVARRRAITACPAGHPYDAENTYVDPTGGRRCRACALERQLRRKASA